MLNPRSFLCISLFCGSCYPAPNPAIPKTTVERQMVGLLEKFDRWDDNGDGELDHHELSMGLKGTEYKPERVILFYDTNLNHRISLREAQAGYQRSADAEKVVAARHKAEEAAR